MLAEFAALALACAPQVHASTMQALVMAESEGNPFAIGINGKGGRTLRPSSRGEAVALARAALAAGQNIDAGWAQINSSNWTWLGLTVETVFDPCTNLRAAQTVLTDCYLRAARKVGAGAQALVAGLSCYNTGNFTDGVAKGYVGGVYAQANAPVPAIRGDPGQGLPPLPQPLPPAAVLPGQTAPPTQQNRPAGIRDGFSSNAIPDGFSSNAMSDGFVDPRFDVIEQRIGAPQVSPAPDVRTE